jgi:hypothetical protein
MSCVAKVNLEYRIAGNFHGVQFSRMANLQSFRGLIFTDTCDHAHCTLYNRTYSAGLIFADSRPSAKSVKIGPHENFPLYGMLLPGKVVYTEFNQMSLFSHLPL